MNVALLGKDFSWGGGIDLLRFIANALILKSKEHRLKIYLLLPDDKKITHIFDILSLAIRVLKNKEYELIRKREPELLALFQDSFKNIDGAIEVVRYYNSMRGMIYCLKKIKADIALPAAMSFGKNFPVPWIGYVFDFQHKYYPDFFTSDACLSRDIDIAKKLRDAKAILVNANAVKDDINKFFPYNKCNIFNLPFAATPIKLWFDEPPENIQKKYSLPDNYFLISNKFWVHKSHITAFQALAALGNNGVHIVCTGDTRDYRFPNYFSELKEKICKLGLKNRIHFLGFIPKLDQINIMKKALAVLQPTLFEGGPGGGAVYDAVALGVPAIVTDIPINFEIEGENILFFKSGSFEDMADKMNVVLRQKKNPINAEVLLSQGLARTHKLGDRLLEAIKYTIST
jgi:glycosyltransferase involved in cell wall biosynthesis